MIFLYYDICATPVSYVASVLILATTETGEINLATAQDLLNTGICY